MSTSHRNFANFSLTIDGGKSKTDAAIFDAEGNELARATGPGLAIIGGPQGFGRVVASLRETLTALGSPSGFHTICFGLNGVLYSPAPVFDQVVSALRCVTSASRYIVASDVVTTFVGALGILPGVVIAAGTGSVILAIGTDGRPHPVDGAGPLFGDRGSGYDVGRQGLDGALRFADGVGGSAMLYDQLKERFGGLHETLSAVYGDVNPARVIASFSRNVAIAAEQGDSYSCSIWRRSGEDLARGVAAAASAAGLIESPFPVAWSGGLFSAGQILLDPLRESLSLVAPLAQPRPPLGGALAGGSTLASQNAPVLTSVSTWVNDCRTKKNE